MEGGKEGRREGEREGGCTILFCLEKTHTVLTDDRKYTRGENDEATLMCFGIKRTLNKKKWTSQGQPKRP